MAGNEDPRNSEASPKKADEAQSADEASGAAGLAAMIEAGNCYGAYALYRARLETQATTGLWDHYWGIQALARQGFIVEALKQYLQVDWTGETNESFRLLPARLLKELYFQSNGQHDFLALRSLDLYMSEYLRSSATFPGINAAFLSLVTGDRAQAGRLANSILSTLAADEAISLAPTGGLSTAALYDKLTYVEANFIRGTGKTALDLLRALSSVPGGQGAINNCLRQLHRILPLTGEAVDIPVSEQMGLGTVLVYGEPARASDTTGMAHDWAAIVDRLSRRLDEAGCIAVCGGLAPGFETALAHAALRQGARLNVMLPMEAAQFRSQLVAPYGQDWVALFDEAVHRAEAVSSIGASFTAEEDLERIVDEAMAVSAGMATLPFHGFGHATGHAVRLSSDTGNLDIGIADLPAPPSGAIGRTGYEFPSGQLLVCSIFCDLVGASKLPERQCVDLFAALYRRVSEHLGAARSLLECNTWGDAVFLVFHDIVEAAEAALEIRRITDRLLENNPELDISFRIACHYGLAFEIHDCVRNVRAFTGSSVTKVARIEPVTPPGNVYVTASFAGKLAASRPDAYTLEPVGQIALAKSFGRERVFNLRRSVFDISERELRLLRTYFGIR